MSNEPTNADRAQWAKNALAVFTAETSGGDHPDTMHRDDLESDIGNLVCDLMHYARQQGFDVGTIAQQAFAHFEFEVLDEEMRP